MIAAYTGTIDYTVHGSGTTTVFMLHGAYGDGSYFANTATVLADAGYRVVVWNCPGYGMTPPAQTPSITTFSAAATSLVQSEATAVNVLLGHSMGALIAPLTANNEPLVDAVVLSGASAGFASRTPEDQKRYLAERLEPIENGQTVAEYVRPLLDSMMGPTASGPLVDKVREAILAMRTATFADSIRAIASYDGREALDNLAVPTLLLAGTVDTACPVAGMRAMAERIEDSEIHELEGVGHYGFAERPDEFHGHLLDFLGRRLPKEN
ncbi:alpha/beta hydrolase [Rhodococcus sp. IEGM 1406]|uniref:alpha/beta fold hydrolase n=1 Tax=Rhodococcus sp. IEGM 1406 TaxID=3047083 RepID=UPI0024B71531|nr:alpha/beta hydrolase [Rhodococcus sp. IEGM 1406]MDI9904401.1 alpha/beta hydrolase [Rhodococcus sp. IEGM 1406]